MHAYKEAKAAEDSTKDFDLWCKEQEDEASSKHQSVSKVNSRSII